MAGHNGRITIKDGTMDLKLHVESESCKCANCEEPWQISDEAVMLLTKEGFMAFCDPACLAKFVVGSVAEDAPTEGPMLAPCEQVDPA